MAAQRFAYVILCHHRAEQALRLAAAIRSLSPGAGVILRHDRLRGYIDAAQAAGVGAELSIGTRPAQWGAWSLVAASLEALELARARFDADWYVLLSGQDYPVRDLTAWERETAAGPQDAVIPGEPVAWGPAKWRPRSSGDWIAMRYTHRWVRLPPRGIIPRLPSGLVRVVRAVWYRYLYDRQGLVVLNELPRDNGWALGIRRTRVPWTPETPVIKGEQWLALSRAALDAVTGPQTAADRAYFATTLIPDEAYFATVLGNRPDLRIRREQTSYLSWADDVSAPHPRTLTPASLEAAFASGAPFARKFDEDAVPGLLDRVDARLGLGE